MHEPAHVDLGDFIASISLPVFSRWRSLPPWLITAQAPAIVRAILAAIKTDEFEISDEVAVHRSASVEHGVVLKGPLIVGAHCFLAAGAYLRGGNWLSERCVVGPGSEVKASFLFAGTRLAHFNFVGDSMLGADVNLEAGSVICNYRNERNGGSIQVRLGPILHSLESDKFGAVLGDGTRVGANAVIAPGALLARGSVVPRGALVDQEAQ